jgi:hypothetical protein
MSTLYLFFEVTDSNDVLPRALQGLVVPGYSFWPSPLRATFDAPGEPRLPVRCTYYAQSVYRIFLADRAIQFDRDDSFLDAQPAELVRGEQHLVAAVLEMPQFRLRRWLVTDEGWTDDDERFVDLLREGSDAESLRVELGMGIST